ncbi:MAG: pinensin family lanthipeptide [Acidobacteriota bacterium]|nr:pinensin family lanthipeptide [Acidobacteriota bacterium]
MKKMQLKDLNVKSFITTAQVKGGEFPDFGTIPTPGTCGTIITFDVADYSCERRCL